MSKNIKMIALDLDGTTFDSRGNISEETLESLKWAHINGLHVVVCTGRVWDKLPMGVFKIKGLEYVITSNGGMITDVIREKVIYENPISPEYVEKVMKILNDEGFSVEVSVDVSIGGRAYIDTREYHHIKEKGSDFRSPEYVLNTRNPVDELHKFVLKNKLHVENINMVFQDMSDQRRMEQVFGKMSGITMTSSFHNNLEIGGETTTKASALSFLLEKLGLTHKNLMAFGDSPNDLSMIQMAEIGVVMGNAGEHMKCHGDFVTLSNDENGVSFAIRKLLTKNGKNCKF